MAEPVEASRDVERAFTPYNQVHQRHLAASIKKKDENVLYATPQEQDDNPYSAAVDEEESEDPEPVEEEGSSDSGEGSVNSADCELVEEDSFEPYAGTDSSDSDSEESFEVTASGERDWDAEFQAISAMDPNDIRKHRRMARLADDFQNGINAGKCQLTSLVASTYGRIIISERALPSEKKTIKPADLGGVAGGDKVSQYRDKANW
jgi:hypothetical protein